MIKRIIFLIILGIVIYMDHEYFHVIHHLVTGPHK